MKNIDDSYEFKKLKELLSYFIIHVVHVIVHQYKIGKNLRIDLMSSEVNALYYDSYKSFSLNGVQRPSSNLSRLNRIFCWASHTNGEIKRLIQWLRYRPDSLRLIMSTSLSICSKPNFKQYIGANNWIHSAFGLDMPWAWGLKKVNIKNLYTDEV